MEASDSVKARIGGSTRGVRMAFDRFQGTAFGSESLFSTNKQQGCGTGENGSLFPPFLPLSSFSLPEEPGMSCTPWSVHDDPYQLIEGAQNNKSRNLHDGNDCGSEADLYGLVSDILGEADKMDSYYSEEKFPNSNSVWSPKCMREDYQQYLQPESKIQLAPPFPPSHAYHEPLNKTQDQSNRDSEEMYQRFTSLDSTEQWLFSSCLEDMNSYIPPNQEFQKPPGLQLPTAGNSSLYKARQSNPEYSAFDADGPCGPVHSLSSRMEAFQPQNKINSHGYDHYYEDEAGLNSVIPRRFKQCAMQDVNKLACNMQSLMVGEQDNSCSREAQSRQTGQMQYEATMAEQRKFTSPRMQAHNTPTMQFHKELGGDFGAMQQETDRGGRKLPMQSDFMSNDLSEFGPQFVEYFQRPKALSTASNPANMYQSKMNGQTGSSSLNMNSNLNQFFSHSSQQNQLQNKPKLIRSNCVPSGSNNMLSHSVSEFVPQHLQQTQRASLCIQDFSQGDGAMLHNREGQSQLGLAMDELRRGGGDADFDMQLNKKRMPMTRLGEAFSGQCLDGKITKPHKGNHMGDVDKKGLLHNPYLDNQGSLYSTQRFTGGLNNIGMGKTSPFLPYMYPVSNTRQSNCHMPTMTSSAFNSRASLPYGGCVPLTDLCDLLPDSEFAAFSPFDLMGSSVEGLYPGKSFDLRSPRMIRNRGGSMSQLHCHLEDCYEQWRFLEKERKKTEVILTKTFPGRQISTASSNALPKVPPNPSKVDRLIVDQMRELARVLSLLGKMERLRSIPLHANISSTLDRHQEAIYITQARRKEELINTSSRQRQGGGHFREDRDILLLATALKDLCGTTRKARTALWCALQMTLPKTSTDKLDEQGHSQESSPGPGSD